MADFDVYPTDDDVAFFEANGFPTKSRCRHLTVDM